MRDGQQSLGWSPADHQEREKLIASVSLPRSLTVPGKETATVKRDKILSLLYRLNSTAMGDRECFPGLKTIAAGMGVDEKTVRRTLAICVHLQLLTIELKKSDASRVVCNHYAIRWDVLAQRINRGHPESTLAPAPTPPADRSVRTSGLSRGRSDSTSGHPDPQRSDIRPRASGHTARTDWTRRPDRSDILSPDYGDGDKTKTPAPPRAPRAQPDGDGVLDFRWGRNVDPRELRDPEAIDRLFEIAVCQGAAEFSEADRRSFFALVAYVIRIGRSIGFLTGLIAGRYPNKFANNSRDWRTRPQNLDEDQAKRWLAKIDDDRPQRDEKFNQAGALEAMETERSRQIESLKKSL